MSSIPVRELRNNVSDVLRRAEGGQRFTITVGGRPVAELGPLPAPHRTSTIGQLAELLTDHPVDPQWRAALASQRTADRAAGHEVWSG